MDYTSKPPFAIEQDDYEYEFMLLLGTTTKLQLYVTHFWYLGWGELSLGVGGGMWNLDGNHNMDFGYKSFQSFHQYGVKGGFSW